jgi:hypothetical protein
MTMLRPVARAICRRPWGSRPIPMLVASTMVSPPARLKRVVSPIAVSMSRSRLLSRFVWPPKLMLPSRSMVTGA